MKTFFENHKIHLIGNAHLDPAWLWRWTDGFAEVKATFQSALDRMKEYPDFIFTCSAACYYKWVEDNCPSMFEEIRRRVDEGRWVITGGWWIQPDCNIPCGESFARQSLYSQRYYMEKFGLICKTGYNVDSFGHSAMLPQILSKSGMDHYVFMRPSDHEKYDVPNVFNWKSSDGSEVLTFKIPLGYSLQRGENLPEKAVKTAEIGNELDSDMMLFYGVGNHGGGPTIELIEKIKELQAEYGDGKLVFGSPNEFMESIKDEADKYKTIQDDLQIHAIGCYSAMLKVKQLNRRAEIRLLNAESMDTLSAALLGFSGNKDDVASAWEKVMFNQFHDIICGCSIKPVYDDAQESYGSALNTAGEILNGAAQKISWAIDTMGEDDISPEKLDWRSWGNAEKGTPMVIFNPMPFDVTVPVEAIGVFEAVTNREDETVPIQLVRSLFTNGEKDKWNTLFKAHLPALGYSTYWLHKSKETPGTSEHQTHLSVSEDGSIMENKYIKISFDIENGCISDIIDIKDGKSFTKGLSAVGLVIDETHSDTWGHGLKEYRDVVGSFSKKSVEIIEKGSLRCRVRITSFYEASEITQDFILYNDTSDIEVRVKIHWLEKHKMLKLEFPVSGTDMESVAEIPYGHICREMDGTEKPIQQWIDVGGKDGGLTIVNDSSYAADVKDGVIRLTVLRSPAYADHFGKRDNQCEFMEQGTHDIKYMICPHTEKLQISKAVRKAMEFNTEPFIVYETYHKGQLPQIYSGLSIDKDNIITKVFKTAEDGSGYILRCFECSGNAARAKINIPVINRKWSASFGPDEIKTFLIPFEENDEIKEVNLLEM